MINVFFIKDALYQNDIADAMSEIQDELGNCINFEFSKSFYYNNRKLLESFIINLQTKKLNFTYDV